MKQLLLGHRGYSEIAPENTKLSFDAAYSFGFNGVEMDVHLTKDGKLVIIHDEKIDRTSDKNGYVKDMTYDELLFADFGAKFGLIKIPKQDILTLEEFFQRYKDKFEIINIEIKTDQIHYEGIEAKVLDCIKTYNLMKKVIVSSFNFKSLEILRKLNKDVALGFIFKNNKQFEKASINKIKKVCTYLHPSWKILKKNKDFYDTFNMGYNIWTIKSLKDYKVALKTKGIYSQISNLMY